METRWLRRSSFGSENPESSSIVLELPIIYMIGILAVTGSLI
uniref:TIDP3108 n=1 Tax=Arundo donax TaxID=35708 RepID=A0A0A8ZPN8_ARUDO